jgi:DNA-binding response OmpR family regulator
MTDTSERQLHPIGVAVSGSAGTARRWRTDHAAPARKPSPSTPTTGPNVLVVDDDADVRMLLTMYLALDGFHAEEAEDAATALDAIRRHRPDMVLLDVMMPGRDGWEVCRIMKQHPVLGKSVRIIMVTALDAWDDKREALQRGADDYVEKPFDLPTLAKTVQRNLAQMRAAS